MFTACGGPSPAKDAGDAPPASPPAASAEPASPEAGEPAAKAPPEPGAADESKAEPAKAEGAGTEAAGAPGKGRDITYRMVPGGIVMEVEGLKLEPKAEPVKKGGAWGIHLTLRATATDQHMHRFLSPEGGPLMVAAEIEHAGGKKERITDERKGDGEEFVAAGDSTKLERDLKFSIKAGEAVTVFVGLWGLGLDAEDRKPLKKLFQVRMVAGSHKPQPVITAPE